MTAMNVKANWTAWGLHGGFGAIAGGLIGFCTLIEEGPDTFWIRTDLVIFLLIGGALIGAGLGSRYGDRLWLGENYHILPPDEPEQSNLSDWLSWCLVAAGVATCVVTILKHFQVL
jgi:hypothetical protein